MRTSLVSVAVAATLAAMMPASASADPASVLRGQQIATVSGCRSCHGADLAGKPMLSDPTIALLFSSNLTRRLPAYTDAQLDRVIRTGVRPDGSHLWLMAATPYAVLSRQDGRDLIAYLRSRPPTGPDHPRVQMGPRFIKAVKAGRFKPESLTLADDLAHPPADLGPRYARGRYLVRTTCAGCHMPNLRGVQDPQPGDPPDLIAASAYDRDGFRQMMRSGKGSGDREMGEMSTAVRERFTQLNTTDVDAVWDYLRAWSERR